MTIAKTVRKVQAAGNGSVQAFSYPYRFFEDSDLEVYVTVDSTGVQTLQTLTTHYTVSNNGDETGGTVTMVTAPASGETLTILGAIPLTQGTDYATNDPFPAETHETALDRLTLQVQELQERLDRSLTVPASDATTLTLPSAVDRANKYQAFDASGNAVAVSGTSSSLVVTTFMETVLDDANGDAALTTLGAGSKGIAILKDTTSAAVMTELGITAFAQTVLDDANASDARTTLGLGAAALAGLANDADLSNNGSDAGRRDNIKSYVDGDQWALVETFYDFSVDGAQNSAETSDWADSYEYAISVEDISPNAGTPAIQFEPYGVTDAAYKTLIGVMEFNADTNDAWGWWEFGLSRVSSNVKHCRFVAGDHNAALSGGSDGAVAAYYTGAGSGLGGRGALWNFSTAQKVGKLRVSLSSSKTFDAGVLRLWRRKMRT